jgi:thiamine pyrophosphate-dependent acetolactate synthase large subunit-like protein
MRSMNHLECFRYLARRRTDQLVVTSAGNCGQAWWIATEDTNASFYLGASMSLSTMLASGLALGAPEVRVWAFMGDGAFCMNPGALMVEHEMNLPNLWHILVSNRCYGNTGNTPLPNSDSNDYAAIARGMGVKRIFTFDNMDDLAHGFDEAFLESSGGHTFITLEVEPMTPDELKLGSSPFDGAELKYRFGRHVEKISGRDVFGYRLERGQGMRSAHR